MEKLKISGINGSIELNSKYVYLIIKELNTEIYYEHIIWFEEIEDIVYKKPTRDKYGFITFYLITKSIITKKKNKYTILLDEIDEKNIDSNRKIFDFIKSIISNKEVKVKEVIADSNTKNQDEENHDIIIEEGNNEIRSNEKDIIKDNNIEVSLIIDNKSNNNKSIISIVEGNAIDSNNYIEKEIEIKSTFINTLEEIKEVDSTINEEKNVESNIKLIDITDEIIEKESSSEEIFTNDLIENTTYEEYLYSEDLNDKELEEQYDTNLENEVIDNKKSIKTIEKLKKKIRSLEKELQIITFKDIILSNHLENISDRSKLDKLIIDLKKTIEKLEKIKKELLIHEKEINLNDFIKLNNGNIIITNLDNVLLDDKKKLQNYLLIYKESFNKVSIIEQETYTLSIESERKKKELKITDLEYEEEINMFRNVKSNQEFINNYIKKTKEDLKKVKWKIEKTIEPHVKYKYVKRSISDQTKRLASLTLLNNMRPNRSKLSMIALSLFTGISSIGDLLGYDLKKEEYDEVIQKETLIGFDYLDTNKARLMINNSKDQIDEILYECEKKYNNYPKFRELRNNVLNIKKIIEEEEKELNNIDDKIFNYKNESKVKVLRYNREKKD